MSGHTYPTEGRRGILRVLDDAGYVEYPEFARSKSGYFCRTCTKMDSTVVRIPDGFAGYYCLGLKVPVSPHGCCNYWVYAPHAPITPRKNPSSAFTIRESQGDGHRIDTDAGYIDYRQDGEGCNEVWWIESRRRGGATELMGLMLRHHPADCVAWGATSEAGQAFREAWHRKHPDVVDATGGDRVPFEGQFDPYEVEQPEVEEDES